MSNLVAQLRMACLFGAKAVSRRRASFWPLWLALAAAEFMLIFMGATGHAAALNGTNLLALILGATNVTMVYNSFLFAGMLVCLLQSQLLILRSLREERRQLLQLIAIGINPRMILVAKGVEYTLHALVGALIGSVLGKIAVVAFLPSTIPLQALFSGVMVTLTIIPTALFCVNRFLKSSRQKRDIMI